jgi:hypothetical protein
MGVFLGWLAAPSKSGFNGYGQTHKLHLWRGDVAVARRARFEAMARPPCRIAARVDDPLAASATGMQDPRVTGAFL